jgi:hypothetical protein
VQGKRIRVDPARSEYVNVNGLDFCWTVHHTGDVIVQHASGFGSAAIFVVDSKFAPKHLPNAIKLALEAYWEPQPDGPNHWYRLSIEDDVCRLSDTWPRDETL